MSEEGKYQRLLNKEDVPTEKRIRNAIGVKTIKFWDEIRKYLDSNYDFMPELDFMGKKYGWSFRYRRKNKTLCVLFPESGAFTVLITMGKKEIEEANNNFSAFNKSTQRVFSDARQYHDGKWIYKRVLNNSDCRDAELLITIKKKPKGLRNA